MTGCVEEVESSPGGGRWLEACEAEIQSIRTKDGRRNVHRLAQKGRSLE